MVVERGLDRSFSHAELRDAAVACYDNAVQLYEDAALLFEAERYPRAGSLAICGFEELAKARICLGLRLKEKEYSTYRDHQVFWKFWHHHAKKGTAERIDFYGGPGADPALVDRAFEEGKNIESWRNAGLYVGVAKDWPPTPPPGEYILAASSVVVMPTGVIGYTVAMGLLMNLQRRLDELKARIGTLR